MRSIIRIVGEEAGSARVLRVKVAIGELSCILPDALRFCFSATRAGTVLETATLDIERVPAQARCVDCGETYALPATGARCSCGSMQHELLAGDELKVVEIELE